MIRDFYYLDSARLNMYLLQIVDSLDATDKSKKLDVEFSIVGPKVKIGQDERIRSLSEFEKIEMLEKYLSEHNELTDGRPSKKYQKVRFVRETLDVMRVEIPSSVSDTPDQSPLVFWLCPANQFLGSVCLLQSCNSDDGGVQHLSLIHI